MNFDLRWFIMEDMIGRSRAMPKLGVRSMEKLRGASLRVRLKWCGRKGPIFFLLILLFLFLIFFPITP
jgi:hypothetical protein